MLRDMRALYDSIADCSGVQTQCAVHRVIVEARCPYLAAAMRWQCGDHDRVAGTTTEAGTAAAEPSVSAASHSDANPEPQDPVVLEVPDLEVQDESIAYYLM